MLNNTGRRVVITSMGLIDSLGNSTIGSWQRLIAGQFGIRHRFTSLFRHSSVEVNPAALPAGGEHLLY
ncbi:hypothetical protein, partial [Candidatus Erwinia dacicola]